MNHAERSVFTDRVIRKLELLRSMSPRERLRAAKDLREALADDEVVHIVRGLTLGRDVPERRDRTVCPIEDAVSVSRNYRSPRVRDGLIYVMLHDPMEEMRLKAAGALASQRDPEAIPFLRQAVADPRNPKEVVGAAKSTISFLESLAEAAPSEAPVLRLRSDMERAASDRQARVELMRRLKAALQDPEHDVRNQAIKALVELGDKRAVPAIAKLLDDPVPGIRQSAAVALGDLGSPAALPALLTALGGGGRMQLQSVLTAIGRIGDRRALPALLAFLGSTRDYNLIVMAMNPILALITADDLEQLRQSIAAAKTNAKFSVHLDWLWASALGKAADERYVPDIAEQLRLAPAPPTLAPHQLFQALGRIGGDEAVAALKEHLYAGLHEPAAEALMNLGEHAREIVREALYSDDRDVRLAACRRINFGGGYRPAADKLLEMASTETDPSIKLYAKAAWKKSMGLWKGARRRA